MKYFILLFKMKTPYHTIGIRPSSKFYLNIHWREILFFNTTGNIHTVLAVFCYAVRLKNWPSVKWLSGLGIVVFDRWWRRLVGHWCHVPPLLPACCPIPPPSSTLSCYSFISGGSSATFLPPIIWQLPGLKLPRNNLILPVSSPLHVTNIQLVQEPPATKLLM